MTKQYFLQGFAFLTILVAICYGLQFILDHGLRKSGYDAVEEWEVTLHDSVHSDVVIMGSSNAKTMVSPISADSVFGGRAYNLGLNGYQFYMQFYKYQLYVQKHGKPDVIIQCVSPYLFDDLNSGRPLLYEGWQFLPYLSNERIRSAMPHFLGGFDFKDYYFPLYKYHNNLRAIGIGLQSSILQKKYVSRYVRGYDTLDGILDTSSNEYYDRYSTTRLINPDSVSMRLFENFIKSVRNDNISIILLCTPEYIGSQESVSNRAQIMRYFTEISKSNNIRFLDYSMDSLCLTPSYFFDALHLNTKGATIFNRKLAKDLVGH